MYKYTLCLLALLLTTSLSARETQPLYRNPQATPEARTEDLLRRMTLAEKIAQMQHIHFGHFDSDGRFDPEKLRRSTDGLSRGCAEAFPYSAEQYLLTMMEIQREMRENTRLGIPVFPVLEGLHGVVQNGCTIFPQSIAVAATFDPGYAEAMGRIVGREARAIGGRQVLAPVLDIAREHRWGRVEETYGEDPFLISEMGLHYIRGLQQNGMVCTPKHFVAHGTPITGLNLASVHGGMRELLDLYALPFERIIREARPLSIMNCYSSYDGEPVTGSRALMTGLLRDTLGFRGYVYSDWGSVEMLTFFQRVCADHAEAARRAIEAGIDLEAGSDCYDQAERLVREGILAEKYIDTAVRHILYAKFASGLFDEPMIDTTEWRKAIHTPEAINTALRMARESHVLLENRNGILPLKLSELRSIAVIGPNADCVQFGDYTWSSDNRDGITPLAGIRELTGDSVKIRYAPGCDLWSQDRSGFREAVRAARRSDVAIVVVGSRDALLARKSEPATCGEGYDLSSLKLSGVQEELIQAVGETGKPLIVVLVTGRVFELARIRKSADALMVQWYAGEQAGKALAELLFGRCNPSGRLPVSFPQSIGHLPCYYNHLPTDKGFYNQKGSPDKPGRDFVFSNPDPLYPFGYGLSYTRFAYEKLELAADSLSATDTLTVRIQIANIGNRPGKEVVQLYLRDPVSSVVTPIKQLAAFRKIALEPGGKQTVELQVPIAMLRLHDPQMRRLVEPGDFEVLVGPSSADTPLRSRFRVIDPTSTPTENCAANGTSHPQIPGHERIKVTGTVRDIQASVLGGIRVFPESEPQTGTKTDASGRFSLEIRRGDRLHFSSNGFRTHIETIREAGAVNVTLIPEIE